MDTTAPARIAFVGGFLPRLCGIATFTHDLCEAVATAAPASHCFVGAVNDRVDAYEYPPRVRFEIDEKDLDSYRRGADFLNFNNADVLCVQHEFGIYGGPAGGHLLALLKEVRMPVVTTLHTVLREPNTAQRTVMDELVRRSDRLVVMAHKGAEILQETYAVPEDKVDVIPHGIDDIPFVDSSYHKAQFGVEGRMVLLTFGLLGPGKGIEYAILALPEIVKRHPNVVYLVLGATHPHLVAREGESYRLGLERLAEDLGVKDHVIFYNRFVVPGRSAGIHRGHRHLPHALPERGADHFRHAGLRVRGRQGGGLDALLACPGTAGRRSGRPGAVPRPGGHRRGRLRVPGRPGSAAINPREGLPAGTGDHLAGGGATLPRVLPARAHRAGGRPVRLRRLDPGQPAL